MKIVENCCQWNKMKRKQDHMKTDWYTKNDNYIYWDFKWKFGCHNSLVD
jgi:hypothetical protein